MTPLPKHLEEMRDELAEQYFAKLDLKYVSPSIKEQGLDGLKTGFNAAAIPMLKDMESMAKTLEFYRDERNWMKKEGHACSWILADTGTKAKEELKNYHEKYGVKK